MKISGIILALFGLGTSLLHAQDIIDARQSVILEAEVQESPPRITLKWVLDTNNGGYTIRRKAKSDPIWVDSLVSLGAGSTSWTDTSVAVGTGYEYQVIKSLPAFPFPNGTPNFGTGYIYSGIKVPPVHHRGSCLLVIDSTFKLTLAPEISRLITDIEADGWNTRSIYVDRNDPVTTVKSYIISWAESFPDIHQAVFLLGRVPVPYSGEIAPDGHHNDHRGAWPSDGYYGCLDGVWTDQTVNINGPGTRHDNVPGDGKFDNNVFPAPLQLQVGRVDFANMTKFPESEGELLQRYLNKDHQWRTGKAPAVERALIDNNYPLDLEALGQTAWKNFTAMFGFSKVKELPYRQTLSSQSYMWSFGCGGGGPESASDISNTTNFTTDSLQTVFTLLFGSYFGDWDYPNNFLRAAIASRTCLASTWATRPNWYLQHMALGEHIGYSAQLTMSNTGRYAPPYWGIYVHSALMGDPTIRMHILEPIENLNISQTGLNVQLSWEGPSAALGYFIYKKTDADTSLILLNQVPVTGTSYTDPCLGSGVITYTVRGVELRSSASGTYYNLSAGVSGTIQTTPVSWVLNPVVAHCSSGQTNGSVSLDPQTGCPPYAYQWNTGDTTAEVQGLGPGSYCVTITDCLGCSDVFCTDVTVTSKTNSLLNIVYSVLFPNPAVEQVVLMVDLNTAQDLRLDVFDARGSQVAHQSYAGQHVQIVWDIRHLPAGLYRIRMESEGAFKWFSFVKN
ncbi:MAG TPA: T9SS type A sorting domain-containing protein [Saprospiraceae bacterium]|nr:T9SS type A sorting domain-containing protein [Saprospiraceae bacterium]